MTRWMHRSGSRSLMKGGLALKKAAGQGGGVGFYLLVLLVLLGYGLIELFVADAGCARRAAATAAAAAPKAAELALRESLRKEVRAQMGGAGGEREERLRGEIRREVEKEVRAEAGKKEKVREAEIREAVRKEVEKEVREKGMKMEGEREMKLRQQIRKEVAEELAAKSDPRRAAEVALRLPPCAVNASRAQSFLMVFMGHSGSSAILSEMGQHSKFHVTIPEPVDHGEYETDTNKALQYADEFFSNGTRFNKIAGFKMRPFHIMQDSEAWRKLLRKHQTRIIWQYRSNLFKQAVGEYTHEFLGDTSVVEGLRPGQTLEERCKKGAGCRFRIHSLDHLHKLLTRFAQNDEQIKAAVHLLSKDNGPGDKCVLPVVYEDYLYSRENIMRQIFGFMGVPPEDHPPSRRKATKDNMCEVVENFDEVCDGFYGCAAWRWMLNDAVNGCKCSGISPSKFTYKHPYCEVTRED